MFEFSEDDLLSVVSGGNEVYVRSAALEFPYAKKSVLEGALTIGRLLLYPIEQGEKMLEMNNKKNTPYELWMERLKQAGDNKARYLGLWLSRPPLTMLYPLFLYNRSFGATRAIIEKILTFEKSPPPYLDLIWLNLFRQALGHSHTTISELYDGAIAPLAQEFHALLRSKTLLDTWLASKRESLRFYAGETNTVAGMYDEHFANSSAGTSLLRRDAECCFDLGGGFSTNEIARLLGRDCISADIQSPDLRAYDPELVLMYRDGKKRRVMGEEARERYLSLQEKVPYMSFDVLEDSFPENALSYLIISTGFMTSTVRPRVRPKSLRSLQKNLPSIWLSLHAIARVVELAAKGKDVDLFTIQRATTRLYKYKTCLLQWRAGKLTQMITTDEQERGSDSWERWRHRVYDVIAPTNAAFSAALENA